MYNRLQWTTKEEKSKIAEPQNVKIDILYFFFSHFKWINNNCLKLDLLLGGAGIIFNLGRVGAIVEGTYCETVFQVKMKKKLY